MRARSGGASRGTASLLGLCRRPGPSRKLAVAPDDDLYMTTLNHTQALCPLCGTRSEQVVIGSSSSFGSTDLDLRPPELVRSTLPFWIATCPGCGVVAGAGLELEPAAEHREALNALLTTTAYTDAGADHLPDLARDFLRHSLVLETLGNHGGGGWSTLHAAWACDDSEVHAGARECRLLAVARFEACAKRGERFAEDTPSERMVVADSLRRAGRHTDAVRACDAGLCADPSSDLDRLLRFVRELCQERDTSRHTVEEAGIGPG